jgi:hypothetical protein
MLHNKTGVTPVKTQVNAGFLYCVSPSNAWPLILLKENATDFFLGG